MSVEQAVTTDPRVLPRERCVTRYLLDDLAKTQPDKEFAVFAVSYTHLTLPTNREV